MNRRNLASGCGEMRKPSLRGATATKQSSPRGVRCAKAIGNLSPEIAKSDWIASLRSQRRNSEVFLINLFDNHGAIGQIAENYFFFGWNIASWP